MQQRLYSTEDISNMLSVAKTTVKRWTAEGKLQCIKTPGGHRKFKDSDVRHFMSQYHYEVHSLPNGNEPRHSDELHSHLNPYVQRSIDEIYENAISGYQDALALIFLSKFSLSSDISEIFDQYLVPALKKIKTFHDRGEVSSIELQIAKNTILHSLIRSTSALPTPQSRNIQMYCLTSDDGFNEIETKAVELLLENLGFTMYNLGTALSKYSGEDIVHQCRPDDVFVVLSSDQLSFDITKEYEALTSGIKRYGGHVYECQFGNFNETDREHPGITKFCSFKDIADFFSQLHTKVA